MEKYFLHRIQKENGSVSKGIEVHDDLDSAVLAYHGRMKNAYGGNPAVTFMSCQITDGSGAVVGGYDETWNSEEGDNTFFMHYIRKEGKTFTKGIDVCADFNEAKASRHAQMEYGYNNPNHASVSYVSCMITDMSGTIMFDETWEAEESEPAE